MGEARGSQRGSFDQLGDDDKTKEARGANLKAARLMNWALMVKLAWRMLTCGELWCDVLRSKYGLDAETRPHFNDKSRSSQVWKGIIWGSELLREGLRWEVHNGERTLFWKDAWLGNETPQQRSRGVVEEDALQARVAEYWNPGKGWKWDMLHHNLAATELVKLSSTSLSQDSGDMDKWAGCMQEIQILV